MPAGLARHLRLRLSLAGSPTLADRIEFTCLCSSRPCYGLVVLSPLLPTPHRCDAVTVRYRTALHRTETNFHRSIPSPSQAHERGSVTRSNVTHPPASPPLTCHPAQSVMDCGGKAQRRHRFRSHRSFPNHPEPLARTIRHFALRALCASVAKPPSQTKSNLARPTFG